MSNSYTYTVWATDATSNAEAAAEGYTEIDFSEDGLLCVADKRDNAEPIQSSVPLKPSYVVEPMSNWPYLTHTEARQLISYEASTSGASDGWCLNDRS